MSLSIFNTTSLNANTSIWHNNTDRIKLTKQENNIAQNWQNLINKTKYLPIAISSYLKSNLGKNLNTEQELYSSKLQKGIHGLSEDHPLHGYFIEDKVLLTIKYKKHNPSAIFTLKEKISVDPLTLNTALSCANKYVWDVQGTKFCNNTMAGHHINPNIGVNEKGEKKANSYSILSPAGGDIDKNGNSLNTLTTLIRSEGTGKEFAKLQIGDKIETAGIVSNYFACPKYMYPMISVCMGSGTVPAISMVETRRNDAKKNNAKAAPHLILTSFRNEDCTYELLEQLNILQQENSNIKLINVFTQSKNNTSQHLFDRDLTNFNIDNVKYSLHSKENFELVSNFLAMPHIHLRLSGYVGVDKQFIHYLQTMLSSLTKEEGRKISKLIDKIVSQQRIRAEGTLAKGIQKNGHEAN